jgi:predicted outer membrane repeat protein
MTITNSTVSGNTAGEGGGIFTEGTSKVTMTDSTVSGNSASVTGGGMLSNAPLTMTNSTVSENSARSYGGGIIAGGTLTLTNSTVSGNTASVGSGGGIYSSGALTLTNSTVSGNSAPAGGGIYNNGGTLTTANSIFANSTGGDCAGTDPADSGGNLADDGACHFSASSSANNVTTLNLGSLANNGGPTETIALLPDSAAIWHAVPTTCQAALPTGAGGVDQRGLPRGTTACDSGAYEFQPYPSTTTLTSSGNPSIVGQSVTFTVTVAATASAHMGVQNAAPIVPTGPVSFSDGSTVLCNAVALVDGIASCMTSALTVGVHTITAAYSGDGTFAASSGMLTQTVNTAAPPAPTASVVGQVTGDGGAAVAHAMVKATYAGGGFAYDTTDGAGHYDIRNLTPGNYVITLVAPSGLTVTSANDIPEAMAGTSEVTINFTLSATAPAGTTTTGMTSAASGSFQPFWVQVFASDAQLYSGQDSNAVAFGPVAQWTYLLVVEPQTSSRLAVYNPVTHNYAYVNADQVGPSGHPRS